MKDAEEKTKRLAERVAKIQSVDVDVARMYVEKVRRLTTIPQDISDKINLTLQIMIDEGSLPGITSLDYRATPQNIICVSFLIGEVARNVSENLPREIDWDNFNASKIEHSPFKDFPYGFFVNGLGKIEEITPALFYIFASIQTKNVEDEFYAKNFAMSVGKIFDNDSKAMKMYGSMIKEIDWKKAISLEAYNQIVGYLRTSLKRESFSYPNKSACAYNQGIEDATVWKNIAKMCVEEYGTYDSAIRAVDEELYSIKKKRYGKNDEVSELIRLNRLNGLERLVVEMKRNEMFLRGEYN